MIFFKLYALVCRKYVVWMLTFPPPASYFDEIIVPKLICAPSNACKDFKGHAKVNLREEAFH